MLPSRITVGQPASRKSRLEGKPSMLPKPRRPGSIDRQSMEARRPSTTGIRSSSAEPPRGTFGGRLSREASATKLPINRRSHSQQGQVSMTPLRSSQYIRPTMTPVRTPSEERAARSWQTCLERALAFVIVKDQRPISNVAWQRAEYSRVQEALAARGAGAGAGGGALVRPLTIARFVDVAGALLATLTRETKLNTDNYVAKLQGLCKRLLYPGAVSKSWLKTVNTLHAFPHALALISYLLDMAEHIETPVSDDWLYIDKGELARLRRDYLYKCWIRFQDPGAQFEDLNEEYLYSLKELLGDNEEKVMAIQQDIKALESRLEDSAESAARAEEARRAARVETLQAALRTARASSAALRARLAALRASARDHAEALAALDQDIQRASGEKCSVEAALAAQSMTVAERSALLDQVDYAARVQDSKRTLAEEVTKMVSSKELELAHWQKKTLDACVQYKQALIRLSAHLPPLAALTLDEKELMEASCCARAAECVQQLRAAAAALSERRAQHSASRAARSRHTAALLEEARAEIASLKASNCRSQRALDEQTEREASEAAAWSAELRDIQQQLDDLLSRQQAFDAAELQLTCWQEQEAAWRSKLSQMQQYIAQLRVDSEQKFEQERDKRVQLVLDSITKLKLKHLVPTH